MSPRRLVPALAAPVVRVSTPPVAMTIAGSDSGGGAGIQADLHTFAAHDVHGVSAITAVTAQNTLGVEDVHLVPASVIASQIRAIVDDFAPPATKTGMLATVETVDLVCSFAEEGLLPQLVVDPVMVATSGDRLLDPSAESSYLERLFDHAVVVTPNAEEAAVLCGRPLTSLPDLHDAAKELANSGATSVLVKGGHLVGDESIDVFWDGDDLYELAAPRLETLNTHGTGCSLAAAITAELAKGSSTLDAVLAAKAFVADGLAAAKDWSLGRGSGPIDHRSRLR